MPSNEEAPSEQPRTRVLILAPVGRDAALACGVLNREQLTAEVEGIALVGYAGIGFDRIPRQ